MTDTEITEKLSEFMGCNYWDFKDDYEGEFPMYIVNDSELIIYENKDYGRSWNPLENISDAWELVDELLKYRVYMNFSLSYDLVLDSYKFALREWDEILSWDYWPNEKSASRAICMAVLKVIENGDESHGCKSPEEDNASFGGY